MADHTWRDETTTRRIYTLKTPTNWVEVSKVLASLRQDPLLTSGADDAVTVDFDGESIGFSFEVPNPGEGW